MVIYCAVSCSVMPEKKSTQRMWRIWPWWWKTEMSGSPWWCYLTQSCVLSRSVILLVCVCVFFSLWKLSVYKMSEVCLNPRSTSFTLWLFIKSVSAFPTWLLAHSRQGINDFCGCTTVKRRNLLTGGSFLSYCRGVSRKSGETGRNRMVSAIGTAIKCFFEADSAPASAGDPV